MARAVLEPRADREIFVVPLEVRPEHIDENGHVNNVVYVGWLQDAGTATGTPVSMRRPAAAGPGSGPGTRSTISAP